MARIGFHTSVVWNVLASQRHAEPDTIGAHVDHMARGWVRIWRHDLGKDAPPERGHIHVMTHSAPEIHGTGDNLGCAA